jgi:hypothetical protein
VTLIESIGAIVILSIAIPPMYWSIRESEYQRVNPVLASRARWLASSKLEDIIADRASTTRGYAYLIPGNYPVESSITGYPGYTRTVTLTETEVDLQTAGSGFMTVDVQVDYTDAGGDTRSMTISTVLTDYTP